MEVNKKVELNEEQLDRVTGGAINVFDGGPYHKTYWKCTCYACGHMGIGQCRNSACASCGSTNIKVEEYNS